MNIETVNLINIFVVLSALIYLIPRMYKLFKNKVLSNLNADSLDRTYELQRDKVNKMEQDKDEAKLILAEYPKIFITLIYTLYIIKTIFLLGMSYIAYLILTGIN